MSGFSKAFTTDSRITQGANGANLYSTSGSKGLDAFNALVQDSKDTETYVTKMFAELDAVRSSNPEARREKLRDLFVLAFYKRATNKDGVCEGQGFKNVFYDYILKLYERFPDVVNQFAVEGMFAVFGYWKDYLHIWQKINEKDDRATYAPLIPYLRDGMLFQRGKDLKAIRGFCRANGFDFKNSSVPEFKAFIDAQDPIAINALNLSLVGKYCVRESSNFNKSCYVVRSDGKRENHINYMIRRLLTMASADSRSDTGPIPHGAFKHWRIINSKLNVILDVPEVKFCAKQWAEIKIGSIPSLCFHRNENALVNETKHCSDDASYDETGDRFPDDLDRVACRNNVIEHLDSGKRINVSQLLPNDIIDFTLKDKKNDKLLKRRLRDLKWKLLLDIYREKMAATAKEIGDKDPLKKALASGNILPCLDTSASMTWENEAPKRPLDIGVSLTLFVSYLASKHYRDKALSFSTDPRVHDFSGMSLMERFNDLTNSPNYSTNYHALHKRMIALCVNGQVPSRDLPVLVIFTDGHFDQMVVGYNDTAHKTVTKMWKDAGYNRIPLMVYWNVSPKSAGAQADKKDKGIMFLNGPSPSNIRFILYGESADDVEVTEIIDGKKVTTIKKDIDPYTIYRKAMDQAYFKPIIDIVEKNT